MTIDKEHKMTDNKTNALSVVDTLKLALEALESCSAGDYSTGHVIHPSFDVDALNRAIEAIREALAEQPAQELLAWKNAAIRVGEELSSVGPNGYYNMTADQWLVWAMDQQPRGKNSLAEQPARQQEQQVNVPVTDNTYGYAKSLAEAIFKKHFASDEHYASGQIVWGVNDTVIGILTQIDNMVADMVRRPAQQQSAERVEPVAYMGTDIEGNPNKFRLNPFNKCVPLYEKPQSVKVWDAEGYDARCQQLEGWKAKASKPWVGLTDEEIQTIWRSSEHMTVNQVFRDIEAKLKEKNQ